MIHDPMPQPSDGPDYWADLYAWLGRHPAVHNHGPDAGPGLACREIYVLERLVGMCQAEGTWNER